MDIVLESCHSGYIPSLFQHLSWSLSGIQGWCLWLFYSVLALAVEGGEVCVLILSILPSCPSLPFCSSQKCSLPEEGKHRKEERSTSYIPHLEARCSSGAAVQHSVSPTALSVQGDEVAWEMCCPLSEWSMPDRGCAEDSSHSCAIPSIFSQAVMSSQIIQSLKIITHWDSPGWTSENETCLVALVTGSSFSAGWFWSGQRTWEIGKDPFRGISWMPLSVNCWAEANALFYVFNSGRTSTPPQQPVSADSCSWESFVWEPGWSDSGQQFLDRVTSWTWCHACRVTTELKAQGTSLPMQIFKESLNLVLRRQILSLWGFIGLQDLVALLVSDVCGRWAEEASSLKHIYRFSEPHCLLHHPCLTFFSLLIFFFEERQPLKAHLHYCKPQFLQSCVALHCQYKLRHKKIG